LFFKFSDKNKQETYVKVRSLSLYQLSLSSQKEHNILNGFLAQQETS